MGCVQLSSWQESSCTASGVHVKASWRLPPTPGSLLLGSVLRGEASWASHLLRKKPVSMAVVGWEPS